MLHCCRPLLRVRPEGVLREACLLAYNICVCYCCAAMRCQHFLMPLMRGLLPLCYLLFSAGASQCVAGMRCKALLREAGCCE